MLQQDQPMELCIHLFLHTFRMSTSLGKHSAECRSPLRPDNPHTWLWLSQSTVCWVEYTIAAEVWPDGNSERKVMGFSVSVGFFLLFASCFRSGDTLIRGLNIWAHGGDREKAIGVSKINISSSDWMFMTSSVLIHLNQTGKQRWLHNHTGGGDYRLMC